MSIRAVLFDLGGVIVRTEYQAPRQHLAERLGMEYDDLVKVVFDSDSGYQASIGSIPPEAHWDWVIKRLKRPASELESIRHEFFAGDIIDRTLLDFLRSLRGKYKTGLISNAWGDLREYLLRERIDDAYDHMINSAEVGAVKPEA
jgi:FMN phosphatase YigB (HAD superfamily)